jgi:serine/threonine protein kinase
MRAEGSIQELQSTDIWSFGCLLSLAATWITAGFPGIQRFAKLRASALSSSPLDFNASFHDGTNTIPEVHAWHENLRCYIQNADHITGAVLDLIEQRLLQSDSRARPTASELHALLTQIQQRAEQRTQNLTDEAVVVEKLSDFDASMLDDASLAPSTQSDFTMDLFNESVDFWDSAVGMESWDAPKFSHWDEDTSAQLPGS